MSEPTIPKPGDKAPNFKLPASNGQTIDLAETSKGKKVVVYFYPKADTPGCTKQACGLRDTMSEFKRQNVAVYGISPDPIEDVKKFSDKFTLNYPLLADADHSVTERYGLWQEKSMYGKKYMGALRTTFIIENGKVLHVFEKVKPEGHEQMVLDWLKEQK
jgi:thioredoxin-dependent peroxiredoxin